MEMLYNLLWQNCSWIFTVGTEILIIANAPSCADACRFYSGGLCCREPVLSRRAGCAAGNRFYSCGLAALMRAGSAPADVGRSCADLPAGRSIRQRYAFPEHFIVSDKVSDFSLCMQMG